MVRSRLRHGLRRHRDAERGQPGRVQQEPEQGPRSGGEREAPPARRAPGAGRFHRRLRQRSAFHLPAADRLHPEERHCDGHGGAAAGAPGDAPVRAHAARRPPGAGVLRRQRGWLDQHHPEDGPGLAARRLPPDPEPDLRAEARTTSAWRRSSANISPRRSSLRLEPQYILALWRSIYQLGIRGAERVQYWRLFFWTLFRRPRLFPVAITLAIYGFHFRQVAALHVN